MPWKNLKIQMGFLFVKQVTTTITTLRLLQNQGTSPFFCILISVREKISFFRVLLLPSYLLTHTLECLIGKVGKG